MPVYVCKYARQFMCVISDVADTLMCSSVAKVSVCPQALLALREQTRVFGQETRHVLLKEANWYSSGDKLEAPQEHHVPPFVGVMETSACLY